MWKLIGFTGPIITETLHVRVAGTATVVTTAVLISRLTTPVFTTLFLRVYRMIECVSPHPGFYCLHCLPMRNQFRERPGVFLGRLWFSLFLCNTRVCWLWLFFGWHCQLSLMQLPHTCLMTGWQGFIPNNCDVWMPVYRCC